MKILVTGFAPFGGEAINPSYEAVRQLPDALGDAHIIKMEIPVAFGKDIDCIAAALEKYNPDAVVCVGRRWPHANHTRICWHQLYERSYPR